jgi:hypothetical protein
MSGSIKDFSYTSDDGVKYAVRRDESNGEATVGGAALLGAFTVGATYTPCGLRARYVNTVLSTDARVRKVFTVGTVATFGTISAGSAITEASGGRNPGGVFSVLSKVGERSRLPKVQDTGLDDGDPN